MKTLQLVTIIVLGVTMFAHATALAIFSAAWLRSIKCTRQRRYEVY